MNLRQEIRQKIGMRTTFVRLSKFSFVFILLGLGFVGLQNLIQKDSLANQSNISLIDDSAFENTLDMNFTTPGEGSGEGFGQGSGSGGGSGSGSGGGGNSTDDFYVHANGQLHVFTDDTLTVFGCATVNGILSSSSSGFVHFYGETWKNSADANLSGDGTFLFENDRPSPYVASMMQYIDGGYDRNTGLGATFPNIHILNENDIALTLTDTKIRDTMWFLDGHLILDGQNLTVGHNDPGVMLGYNETQFVVTNGKHLSDTGYLEREALNTAANVIAFPIGVAINDYTPARITNTGAEDNYRIRVVDSVYEDGSSGNHHPDPSVDKTWYVREDANGASNLALEFQHNAATEGSSFSSSRLQHYITRYVGASNGPSSGGGDTTSGSPWDLLTYSNLYAGESGNGYITTGSAISTAVVTKRSGMSLLGAFTKTVYSIAPLPVELVKFEVNWANDDADLRWSTSQEINNDQFIIERSFDLEHFEEVGSVRSLARGGNSNSLLHYSFTDFNVKPMTDQVVYYRLRQLDYDETATVYGPLVLHVSESEQINWVMFPNPTKGKFTIRMTTNLEVESMTIIDAIGNVLYTKPVDPFQDVIDVDLSGMRSGVYTVKMSTEKSNSTQKIILTN